MLMCRHKRIVGVVLLATIVPGLFLLGHVLKIGSKDAIKYQTCHLTLPCTHFEQYAGVQHHGNKYVWDPCKGRVCTAGSTGNVLSRYWNTRAMLHFAGAEFEVGTQIKVILEHTSFLKYLPLSAPAPSCPDSFAYTLGCLGCSSGGKFQWLYDFPALCNGAWTLFRDTIQRDTVAALMQWHDASNTSVFPFQAHDVVIQYRCAQDTLYAAGYGPMGYTCYSDIPTRTSRIFIVTSMGTPLCEEVIFDLKQYLSVLRPAANISILAASVSEDFSALTHAPFLIRHGQSTFGLWAGIAGSGTVYSIPLPYALNNTPFLGSNWIWRDCPIMKPFVVQNHSQQDLKDIVLKWVQTH